MCHIGKSVRLILLDSQCVISKEGVPKSFEEHIEDDRTLFARLN